MSKKIELTHAISGTRNGEDWPNVGVAFELPEDEAETLIANGDARATKDDVKFKFTKSHGDAGVTNAPAAEPKAK